MLLFGLWAGLAQAQNLPEAQKAAQAKNWPKVVEILGPHLDKLKRDQIFMLALAHSETGNHLTAIKTYEAALALNAKDVTAKRGIGIEYTKMEKDKEAMTAFREALAINKRYEPAYLEIAKIYERRTYKNKGRESKDTTYELRLLFQDLIDPQVGGHRKPVYISKLCELSTLGGHYLKKGGSLEYCEEGIRVDPKEPKNYVYLAMTYKETGNAEKALENFKKAADSFARSEFAQLSLASYYQEQKNFVQSYKYFKRAHQANETSLPALQGLAVSCLEIQKPDEAYAALQAACKIDKKITPIVRKATAMMHQQKNTAWTNKFDTLADTCGLNEQP